MEQTHTGEYLNQNKNKNVLVVDDDYIAHFLSERLLSRLDFIDNIYAAFNGLEALAILENMCRGVLALPDLILLDLHMPVMNGLEFLRAFRKLECLQGKEVAIVVLSSSENPVEHSEVRRLGIAHFIQKPITVEKIREFI